MSSAATIHNSDNQRKSGTWRSHSPDRLYINNRKDDDDRVLRMSRRLHTAIPRDVHVIFCIALACSLVDSRNTHHGRLIDYVTTNLDDLAPELRVTSRDSERCSFRSIENSSMTSIAAGKQQRCSCWSLFSFSFLRAPADRYSVFVLVIVCTLSLGSSRC